MADALPALDGPGIAHQPQARSRIRMEAPPGPIPTQVRSYPPKHGYDHEKENENENNQRVKWNSRDPPPHLDHRGTHSNAIIVRPPGVTLGDHRTQYSVPPPRVQEMHVPSTTFHIGPIPPTFTIEQIHSAMRALNPRIAMIDLRSGIIEIEIPFTLSWSQISDCKCLQYSTCMNMRLMNRVYEGL